jgi:hypothetical protein
MSDLIIDTRHSGADDWHPDGDLYLDFDSIDRNNYRVKLGANKFVKFKSYGQLFLAVRLSENLILTCAVNHSWDDIAIIDLRSSHKNMVVAEYPRYNSGPPYTRREIFSVQEASDHVKIIFYDRIHKEDGRLDSEIMEDIRRNVLNKESDRLWKKYYPNEQDGSALSDYQKDSGNWTLTQNEEVILNFNSRETNNFSCLAEIFAI